MGNSRWRLETALNYLAENVRGLGIEADVEVMIADWSSDGLGGFWNALSIPTAKRRRRVMLSWLKPVRMLVRADRLHTRGCLPMLHGHTAQLARHRLLLPQQGWTGAVAKPHACEALRSGLTSRRSVRRVRFQEGFGER
jgi:hypothetical protein